MEEKNKTIRDGLIRSIKVESSLNQPYTIKGSCARRTVFFPLIIHSVFFKSQFDNFILRDR
jgi:hypothetical protein